MPLVQKHVMDNETKLFLSHFSEEPSKDALAFFEEALPPMRFIFIKTENGIQQAYCTACNKVYLSKGLKAKDYVQCKKCGNQCTVKDSWRGRSTLYTRVYVIFYEKSKINPKAITATGYILERNYVKDFKNVKVEARAQHRYLFEPGKAGREYQFYNRWYEMPQAYSRFSNSEYGYGNQMICKRSLDNIKETVKGTPYEYSTWEQYYRCETDYIKFFNLFSKYPIVEYLSKLGMHYFVKAKLNGGTTFGAINWSGKSIEKVLKIDKQRIHEIMSSREEMELHPFSLRLQQISLMEKSNHPLSLLNELAIKYKNFHSTFVPILKHARIIRAHNYIQKQYKRLNENTKTARSMSEIIQTWRDYIRDCGKLELDLQDDRVLYPKNLHEAHQKTIARIEYKENKELNEKIAKRYKSLNKKYSFVCNGLFIRPARDSAELIFEGKMLNHCVPDYAQDYANGKRTILVIRRVKEPHIPFYTMEISADSVKQCRGYDNKSMSEEVKAFVEMFKRRRLNKRTSVNKSKEAAAV